MKLVRSSTTPLNVSSSLVSVPVLSNAHTFIYPTNGILNGSVQYIFFFCKYKIEPLTAMVSIIGNSGGTTVVIIKIHLKNNLFLSLVGSWSPWYNTLAEEIMENKSKMKIKMKASVYFTEMFSLLNNTVLINFPLAVS